MGVHVQRLAALRRRAAALRVDRDCELLRRGQPAHRRGDARGASRRAGSPAAAGDAPVEQAGKKQWYGAKGIVNTPVDETEFTVGVVLLFYWQQNDDNRTDVPGRPNVGMRRKPCQTQLIAGR